MSNLIGLLLIIPIICASGQNLIVMFGNWKDTIINLIVLCGAVEAAMYFCDC